MTDVKLIPIHEAQDALGGIGRTTLWRLVRDGHLEQVHIGRRAFITADSIDAYVAGLATRTDEAPPTPTQNKSETQHNWDAMLRNLREGVAVIRHDPPMSIVDAREFDEHPAGRSVDLTKFVREEALRAMPLALTLEDGSELIGYFLIESEVREIGGERTLLVPTIRSNITKRVKTIRTRTDAT